MSYNAYWIAEPLQGALLLLASTAKPNAQPGHGALIGTLSGVSIGARPPRLVKILLTLEEVISLVQRFVAEHALHLRPDL